MVAIDFLYKHFLKNTAVSIDTRTLSKGAIFFAIKGENFDGHQFAVSALKKGASLVVVEKPIDYPDKDKIFMVENTLKTLQKIAHRHRKKLAIPIIAITGSNGKTTTKELLQAVLSKKYKTFATQGNLNNHIGVPLTLLSMNTDTEIGIVEMGANHQGEIAFLCEMSAPDYGYITNFGRAHLEGFGGVEGIIKGKTELYRYLKKNKKTVFVNKDDAKQLMLTNQMQRILIAPQKTNGTCANGCIKIGNIKTQLTGAYNIANISVAMEIGKYFKVPEKKINNALKFYRPKNNRSQMIFYGDRKLILDAYNANPSSMRVALENLQNLDTNCKVAILGDMFELGKESMTAHQEITTLAETLQLEELHLVGTFFSKINSLKAITHKNTESLLKYLQTKQLPKNSTVLIKGSRSMELEKILPFL